MTREEFLALCQERERHAKRSYTRTFYQQAYTLAFRNFDLFKARLPRAAWNAKRKGPEYHRIYLLFKKCIEEIGE